MKEYDLEKRTTDFAKQVVRLCKRLPLGPINNRPIDQVIGAAGSIGANYREANDALGKKDMLQRMRISRREAKESEHWLLILKEANPGCSDEVEKLIKESRELINILSSIILKVESKPV